MSQVPIATQRRPADTAWRRRGEQRLPQDPASPRRHPRQAAVAAGLAMPAGPEDPQTGPGAGTWP
jgi:hypothetical protein